MSTGVVIPWFDKASFDEARGLLGESATYLGAAGTHEEYRRVIEQELRTISAVRSEDLQVEGVLPIDLDELREWAVGHASPLSEPETLEAYVDDRGDDQHIVAWPPSRNEKCWCGEDDKYKRHCGALTFDANEIAEQAAELRAVVEEMAQTAITETFTVDDFVLECDTMLREFNQSSGDERLGLLEEIRYETFGAYYYPVLQKLAVLSEAETADEADADLQPILDHALFTAAPVLANYLRFAYAEALHGEDLVDAANELAIRGASNLEALGETLTSEDRAFVASYLVDTQGAEVANAAFEALLADATPLAAAVVCDIAAGSFAESAMFDQAVVWGSSHVRLLLDMDDPAAAEVERALDQLGRIYDAAEEFAVEFQDSEPPVRNQPLLDEGATWLERHTPVEV